MVSFRCYLAVEINLFLFFNEICYIIEMGKKIEKKEPRPIFDRAQIVFLDLNSAIVFIRLIYPVVRFFILNCLFQ